LKPRPSVLKRQKERARLEKRKFKAERLAEKKLERDAKPKGTEGGDPDVDWIVPGPQPKEDEEYGG
jgi:hypothetical protein